MKTTKFSTLLVALCAITIQANAQLKVSSAGQVNISSQTGIVGNINSDVLDVKNTAVSLPQGYDLIWGYYSSRQPNNSGLLTLQSVDGALFTVRANGRVGIYNSNPSAALEIGTSGSSYQIKLNGSLIQSSDERLKENIKDISNSLLQLKYMRSVTYKFKKPAISQPAKSESFSSINNLNKPKYIPKIDTSFMNRNHYGFLAQDVQKIFPDLVYKDSAGMLGIDYIGLIPLIIEALKEQESIHSSKDSLIKSLTNQVAILQQISVSQEQSIIALQSQIDDIKKNCCGLKTKSAKADEMQVVASAVSDIVLYQNIPNPFTQSTEIKYSLPKTVNSASLYIFNIQGSLIKNYNITTRGIGSVSINGSELKPGMYIYTLVVDGKETDTKRMILTE